MNDEQRLLCSVKKNSIHYMMTNLTHLNLTMFTWKM